MSNGADNMPLQDAGNGYRTLKDHAYEQIKEAILSGSLAAGSLTSVPMLSGALGVSRSPVREALANLATEGLVSFERNRGVRILVLNQFDVEEIFDLRILLEVPATYRMVQFLGKRRTQVLTELRQEFEAMERSVGDEPTFMAHDRMFHKIILDHSGNRRLSAFVLELRDQVRSLGLSTVGHSRALTDVLREHRLILAAVEAGDADAARAEMESHIRHTRDLLVDQAIRRPGAGDLAGTRSNLERGPSSLR
ncbi:MAG: GntR family transcriptional regulator [Acidimicrobiales bacterium]